MRANGGAAGRSGIGVRLPPVTVEDVCLTLAETIDWGLKLGGIPNQWRRTRGEGIRVAVLDTGIDAGHPDLAGAIEAARDFTGSVAGPLDRQGHGTHTAGTIGARENSVGVVGVAPECRLLVGKVLGDNGAGDARQVAAGIDWAVEAGADVLSMSLGSPVPSREIEAALRRAVSAGRLVVCAAGNDGRANSVGYPAAWEELAVAVGAVDEAGRLADFSSRGPQVDVCGPGVNVLSTYLDGGYARLSGTSMATPFVSGVVALALAKHRRDGGGTPLTNQAELVEHLQRTARDAGPTGRDSGYGYGLIDPARVVGEEEPEPALPEIRIATTVRLGGRAVEGAMVFVPGSL